MGEYWLVDADDEWRIPSYARDMLWVRAGDRVDQAVRAEGERGRFALDLLEDGTLCLTWGTPDGAILAEWLPDDWLAPAVVGWSGEVAVGGFVERLHALTVRGLDVIVAEVEGSVLPAAYTQVPDLDQMRAGPFSRADDPPEHAERFVYPVIFLPDTLLAEYMHHALVSELAVDCWGALGPQAGLWHELTGLPILLDSITLLAPRRR